MSHPQIAVYSGSQKESGFTGYIAEGNFYAVLVVEEGLSQEAGREFLHILETAITHHHIVHLADFEHILLEKLREANIPMHSSLACVLARDEKYFLKTMSRGKIYLQRGGEFASLIEKDNSASGFQEEGDFFVFTTTDFTEKVVDQQTLSQLLMTENPQQIQQTLSQPEEERDDAGTIALFIQFEHKKAEIITPDLPPIEMQPTIKPNKLKEFIISATSYYSKLQKRQKLILLVVAVVFLLFLFSVMFGYQKKVNAKLDADIKTKKEIITENLNQAQDVAFLNMSSAQGLITSSKKILADLKKEAGNSHKKEIDELEKLIKDKESALFNKEEKPTDVFFDLSVDSSNVKGTKLALDGDNIAILDSNHGIYTLSLSKKSLDNKNPKEVKKATLVGITKDARFFVSDEGVFQVTDDKTKKVIDHDSDWGKITAITQYNSNLYLLDSAKNQIYKYTPTEGGYSAKSSYFKSGDNPKLGDANSLAIDSSVYIGLSNKIAKYISGVADNFPTSFPSDDANITKIFTSADVEKVYAWDKKKGTLYVLAKTGSYEREVKNKDLAKADDFVVSGKFAYLLTGSKILRMSVE